MKCKILLISLCFLSLFSCTKDELRTLHDPDRIYVNVSYNNEPIEGAYVFVEPEKEVVTTNNLGIAVLNGSFDLADTVYAYNPLYGGAQAKVEKNDGTNYLNLQLRSSVLPDNVPVVQVVEPKDCDVFLPSETVSFNIDGTNVENNQDLKISITSSIDGVLFEGTLSEEGMLDISENDLSLGLHTLQINVTNTNGIKYSKVLRIQYGTPEKIQLLKAERRYGCVALSWEPSLSDDFKSYDIYISSDSQGEIGLKRIAQIEDRNCITYTDLFPPFKDEVYYSVRVRNYLELYSISNLIKVEQPNGEIIDLVPDDAFVTKNQKGLILWGKNEGKLLKYDLEELTIEFEKDLPSDIVAIDVDQEEDGNIYAVDGVGKIYVYSSQDLSLLKEISYNLSTFDIMYMGNDKVMLNSNYYSVWGESSHVVDLTNGNVVSKTGENSKLEFRKIPGENAAISITTNLMPAGMAYYEWDDDGEITISKNDSQHGSYPLSSEIFAISDLGSYCITHYNGVIYAADDKMTYLGELKDYGNLYYNYGSYCIKEAKDAIYGITYGYETGYDDIKLVKYSLSKMIQEEEYTMKGRPQYVLSTKDNIVIVSLFPENYRQGFVLV